MKRFTVMAACLTPSRLMAVTTATTPAIVIARPQDAPSAGASTAAYSTKTLRLAARAVTRIQKVSHPA